MTFKPIVQKMQKNLESQWLGSLIFKGLFDGQQDFRFIENEYGFTTFFHSENFNGIPVPLSRKKLETETLDKFN